MILALVVATTAATSANGGRERFGYRAFRYDSAGRRDPFLFRPKTELLPGPKPFVPRTKSPRPRPVEPSRLVETALHDLAKGRYEEARKCAEEARRRAADPELIREAERVLGGLKFLLLRREAEAEVRKSLRVDAILWSEDEPAAVINGRTRREGDALDDRFQVYRIEKSRVVFLYKNFIKVRKRLGWSESVEP